MNNQSALWLYTRVIQHKKITLCYFDVTNSYSKNLFSPALIYIFPPSFVLSGTKFAEACFTSEGHQEGQLRQPEHFNKITLLQRINGEMLFFLSFSLFFKAGLKYVKHYKLKSVHVLQFAFANLDSRCSEPFVTYNAIGFLTLVWSHIRYKKTSST